MTYINNNIMDIILVRNPLLDIVNRIGSTIANVGKRIIPIQYLKFIGKICINDNITMVVK